MFDLLRTLIEIVTNYLSALYQTRNSFVDEIYLIWFRIIQTDNKH